MEYRSQIDFQMDHAVHIKSFRFILDLSSFQDKKLIFDSLELEHGQIIYIGEGNIAASARTLDVICG